MTRDGRGLRRGSGEVGQWGGRERDAGQVEQRTTAPLPRYPSSRRQHLRDPLVDELPVDRAVEDGLHVAGSVDEDRSRLAADFI